MSNQGNYNLVMDGLKKMPEAWGADFEKMCWQVQNELKANENVICTICRKKSTVFSSNTTYVLMILTHHRLFEFGLLGNSRNYLPEDFDYEFGGVFGGFYMIDTTTRSYSRELLDFEDNLADLTKFNLSIINVFRKHEK